MKKSIYFSLLLIIGALFTIGCKKDEKPPVVLVTPTNLQIYGDVNDVISFTVEVTSEVKLSRVSITAQPTNQVATILLDTVITTKNTKISYYYKLPAALAGKDAVIEFKAENENGITGNALRRVFVDTMSPVEKSLIETAGHRIYSNLSANPDAYDLETNAAQFSTVGDSTLRDIQDASDLDTVLSKTWTSPAGGKFVLFSGFDYANATDTSAFNAYMSGSKLTILNNLKIGDIIITKLGSTTMNKYIVIRITNIIDKVGKDDDYYEFSIKK